MRKEKQGHRQQVHNSSLLYQYPVKQQAAEYKTKNGTKRGCKLIYTEDPVKKGSGINS
jgi:hypothetical protein